MNRILGGGFLWLALLAACLVSGCAGKKAAMAAKPLSQAEMDALIRKNAVEDPALRSQIDFGLDARRSAANKVQATVKNKTPKTIVVGPRCFALIQPGQRKPLTPEGKSLKLFPVAKLPAGEEASGELLFPVEAIPPGSRLAFDARDGSQPAMTQIR